MIHKNTPMTLDNQHWVLSPEWDGSMVAQTVYAPSPEEAVQAVQDLFREAGTQPAVDLASIRLASGEELPWNDPKNTSLMIVLGHDGVPGAGFVIDLTLDDAKHLYGKSLMEARPATAEEKEKGIRLDALDRDERDEEQFNYGFNVAYCEMRDNGEF